jgi:hypothetical protein
MNPRRLFWFSLLIVIYAWPGIAQTVAQKVAEAVPVTDPGVSSGLDALGHQIGLIGITVWVLQQLKRTKFFPWLNANTETANSLVSTGAALVSALAIQFTITGDTTAGWHGTFAIPNLHALGDDVVRFVGSKIGQEALYTMLYRRPVEVVPVPPPAMDQGGKPAIP